jgi:hypothetical protein
MILFAQNIRYILYNLSFLSIPDAEYCATYIRQKFYWDHSRPSLHGITFLFQRYFTFSSVERFLLKEHICWNLPNHIAPTSKVKISLSCNTLDPWLIFHFHFIKIARRSRLQEEWQGFFSPCLWYFCNFSKTLFISYATIN